MIGYEEKTVPPVWVGDNLSVINNALSKLIAKNVVADIVGTHYSEIFSSSEVYFKATASMNFLGADLESKSFPSYNQNTHTGDIRFFTEIKNLPLLSAAPKIGDVIYMDLSYGSADNYNAAKTPAGIIVYVSGNKKSVKVMNLGVVHSIDKYSINPDTPYQGAFGGIRAYPAGTLWKDIAAIPNIEAGQPLIKAIKCGKYEF